MTDSPPPLIDIGANLTNKAFGSDLPAVLERARAAGVHEVIVTGTSLAGSRDAGLLAGHHGLHFTAGVHPHNAKDTDPGFARELLELLTWPGLVAIGECGLDYDRNFSPPERQTHCFEEQLQLATDKGLPVFLHERAAHEDFCAIMRNHRSGLVAAVVHCFTGTAAELEVYLGMGLHIGITGWICDDRRGLGLRDIVGRIPADKLMLETDAPYLLPKNMAVLPRSRRNEPAFLPLVLDMVALSRKQPRQQVATATTATARAFFRLAQ